MDEQIYVLIDANLVILMFKKHAVSSYFCSCMHEKLPMHSKIQPWSYGGVGVSSHGLSTQELAVHILHCPEHLGLSHQSISEQKKKKKSMQWTS